jgi:hypothetical protein
MSHDIPWLFWSQSTPEQTSHASALPLGDGSEEMKP